MNLFHLQPGHPPRYVPEPPAGRPGPTSGSPLHYRTGQLCFSLARLAWAVFNFDSSMLRKGPRPQQGGEGCCLDFCFHISSDNKRLRRTTNRREKLPKVQRPDSIERTQKGLPLCLFVTALQEWETPRPRRSSQELLTLSPLLFQRSSEEWLGREWLPHHP